MIITCPNCKKKFNINPTLINDEGRDLKCGSCDHVWHYKVEEVNSTVLTPVSYTHLTLPTTD